VNFSLKPRLGVSGKMSTEDAGKVGIRLADAAMVLALYGGLAALVVAVGKTIVWLIDAIRWW